jgi:hypothetical protein
MKAFKLFAEDVWNREFEFTQKVFELNIELPDPLEVSEEELDATLRKLAVLDNAKKSRLGLMKELLRIQGKEDEATPQREQLTELFNEAKKRVKNTQTPR